LYRKDSGPARKKEREGQKKEKKDLRTVGKKEKKGRGVLLYYRKKKMWRAVIVNCRPGGREKHAAKIKWGKKKKSSDKLTGKGKGKNIPPMPKRKRTAPSPNNPKKRVGTRQKKWGRKKNYLLGSLRHYKGYDFYLVNYPSSNVPDREESEKKKKNKNFKGGDGKETNTAVVKGKSAITLYKLKGKPVRHSSLRK